MLRSKSWRPAVVGGLGLLVGVTAGWATGERPPTYVWLFSATGAEAENLTAMVTEEFEEALGRAGCLTIVERRELPELESHQRQEQRISADSLSPRERRQLSTANADAIVFGKITDDIQGGQIKIAVTLETLSGVTLADTSVRIIRGKRFDAEERERRMADLALEVCSALGFTRNDSASNGDRNSGHDRDGGHLQSSPPIVEEGDGLKVELNKCFLRGDKVTCSFAVTSTTKDRKQYLRESRLIERDGNELPASAQQFGTSTSKGGQVYASLVRNIIMKVTVTFEAVNPELARSGISLIELRFDDLTAQFRDIRPD